MNKTASLSLAMIGLAACSALAAQPSPARKAPGKRGSAPTRVVNGVAKNIYSLSDNNQLMSEILTSADKGALRIASPKRAGATRAVATGLNESFEDFPGITSTWLPEGWERTSSSSKESWKVGGVSGGLRPTNGKYQAFITSAGKDAEQNEWLISPEFVPEAGLRLYADITASLFSIYDDQYFDKVSKEFSKRKVTATMSIKVYCDGAWSEIFNVRDLASRLEDTELYEEHSSPEVHTARLSLNSYAGKPIKIAFVYSGSNGGAMALDYISTGKPNNMAVYRRPQGFFFEGMGIDWSADQNFAPLVGPAYTDAKWWAEYTRDVEEVKWTFTDPYDATGVLESNDWNPTVFYPYAVAYAPEITAKSDGSNPLTYQFDVANKADGIVKYGGGGIDWDADDNVIEYGCGSYNWRCGIQAPVFANAPGAYLFGPSSNKQFWNTAGLDLVSIGSYYEKPVVTYIFDKVWIHVSEMDADADTPFFLNIYRINDNGEFEPQPMASSKVVAKDVIRYNTQDGGHIYTIVFPFDLQSIDSAIMMEFSGFMDGNKVRSFSPLCQNNFHVDGENNGYLFLSNGSGMSVVHSSSMLSNFYCPFIFTFNATYPFLLAEEDTFISPEEGGEKDFEINSYYTLSSWEIAENIPEWIADIEPVEYTDSEGEYHSVLRVATEPLPASEKGRSWRFTLKTPGCQKLFTINQGDLSGVGSLSEAASRSGVAYDVNGHCLGRVTLKGHVTVEGMAADCKGVIIVRLDNGDTIKIIR